MKVIAPGKENKDLKKRIKYLELIKADYERIRHDLGERVKELNCLYGIAKLIEESGQFPEKVLSSTVNLIPPSWQYPEVTEARIIYKERAFATKSFRKSKWFQKENIYANKEKIGEVSVYYTKKMPQSDEGPFLKEERALINGIAQRLGRFAEQENALAMLESSRSLLRDKNKDLKAKNIALRELVAQFELEKRDVAIRVSTNAQQILLPVVERLSSKGVAKEYIKILKDNIQSLTSDFGPRITNPQFRLSAREIQVTNMIKSGFSSKQIAESLALSFQTIESYRKNIRKKLGITTQGVNLSSFLRSL